MRIAIPLFFLFACGGSITPDDPPLDAAPDVIDAAPSDASSCTWVCNPSPWDTDLYQNTCTKNFCPGTGGCASHFVPNPCADQ
jgi:hypothetical protein